MANPMLQHMMEVLVNNYNVSSAMGREAAARGLGLDPEPYKHPYPGSTNYTVNVVTPGESKAEAIVTADVGKPAANPATAQSGGSWWPWIGGLATGALPGLAVAGLALWMWLSKPAAPAPHGHGTTETVVDNVELEVKWRKLEGGQWQPVVTPVPK
jgi:hypothetical protein